MSQDKRLLVWAIIASHIAPPFMFSGVAVALPAMGTDLKAGATSLALVETLFLAAQLACLLPIGRLAAASSKETLFKAGLLVFGLASIAIGLLSWMPVLLALRLVQGAASAAFSATGPAILAEIVPPAERGRAFGLSIGAVYVGLTLGPVGAGVLTDLWGWRAVFLGGGAILFAMYLLVQVMLPSIWRRPPAGAVHLPSVALLAAAAFALVTGSANFREGLFGYASLVVGFILAGVFVGAQRRAPQPVVDVRLLLANGPLASALLVQFLLYLSAFAVTFLLSIYMQVALGYAANVSGQILATGTILMAIAAPIAGTLSDRYRPRTISAIGVAIVLVSMVMGTGLDEAARLPYVIAILATQGLGFALFSSPNMNIIMSSVPSEATSIASALGATARSFGMFVGMLMTALLISLRVGHAPVDEHPADFVAVMTIAFVMLAALTALLLVLMFVTERRRPAGGNSAPR